MFPSAFILHVTFTSAFLTWSHYFGDILPQQMCVAFAGIDFHHWFVIGSPFIRRFFIYAPSQIRSCIPHVLKHSS